MRFMREAGYPLTYVTIFFFKYKVAIAYIYMFLMQENDVLNPNPCSSERVIPMCSNMHVLTGRSKDHRSYAPYT
jgi:hypothetical protein